MEVETAFEHSKSVRPLNRCVPLIDLMYTKIVRAQKHMLLTSVFSGQTFMSP